MRYDPGTFQGVRSKLAEMATGFAAGAVCDISLNTKLTPEQREKYQNTKVIREIISEAKTIAVVGLSTESTKASNMVASYRFIPRQMKVLANVPILPSQRSRFRWMS